MISIPIILVLAAVGWLLTRFKGWQFRQMLFGVAIGLMCAGTAVGTGFSEAVQAGAESAGSAIATAYADLTDNKK